MSKDFIMRKITLTGFLLILLFGSQTTFGQNEKFKALFLYNFTKYIEWPSEHGSGDFIVGILGNSPMKKELEIIASKKQVGSQRMRVESYSGVNDIGKCHILFIPPGKSASLGDVLKKIGTGATLIITDKPGLARKGAGINYVLKEGHQDFEINKGVMQKHSLKVNSALFALGTVIN